MIDTQMALKKKGYQSNIGSYLEVYHSKFVYINTFPSRLLTWSCPNNMDSLLGWNTCIKSRERLISQVWCTNNGFLTTNESHGQNESSESRKWLQFATQNRKMILLEGGAKFGDWWTGIVNMSYIVIGQAK